jgi:succinyl-diaminopimelate desuccinylase
MSNFSEAVLLAQALVKIPSENPKGTERECALFVEKWLRKLNNVSVTTQEVEPGRSNVIAKFKGHGSSCPIVIIAHMDTVPVEGNWTVHPFSGEIRDAKLYGRGSCDMKSGLACALMVIKYLSENEVKLKSDVYVIATVDEEGPYMKGAMHLVKTGMIPSNAYLIATEPTNLTLSTMHKGTIWYELIVLGKSSHGGNAHLGADAIHAASEIIVRLKEKVKQLPYNHPVFGRPTVSVGTIKGGKKTNMVAESCRVELDFRLVPPMIKDEANQLVKEAAEEGSASVPGTSVSVKHYGWERPPLITPKESAFVQMFKQAYEDVTGTKIEESGFPAYTDVAIIGLNTGNNNLIVFGPGHLNQAHAVDEFVEIDQIDICTKVLIQFIMQISNVSS